MPEKGAFFFVLPEAEGGWRLAPVGVPLLAGRLGLHVPGAEAAHARPRPQGLTSSDVGGDT